MKSLIQSEKECFVCGARYNVHAHHIFEGSANRKKSNEDGMIVYLCGRHHNLSTDGVHFNKTLDLAIKKLAQRKYEEAHTRQEFIKRYGKSYL